MRMEGERVRERVYKDEIWYGGKRYQLEVEEGLMATAQRCF